MFMLSGNLPPADTLAWVRFREPLVGLPDGSVALVSEADLCHPWSSWTPIAFLPEEECTHQDEITMCMTCMPTWHIMHSIKIGSKKSEFIRIELDLLVPPV